MIGKRRIERIERIERIKSELLLRERERKKGTSVGNESRWVCLCEREKGNGRNCW